MATSTKPKNPAQLGMFDSPAPDRRAAGTSSSKKAPTKGKKKAPTKGKSKAPAKAKKGSAAKRRPRRDPPVLREYTTKKGHIYELRRLYP